MKIKIVIITVIALFLGIPLFLTGVLYISRIMKEGELLNKFKKDYPQDEFKVVHFQQDGMAYYFNTLMKNFDRGTYSVKIKCKEEGTSYWDDYGIYSIGRDGNWKQGQ